MEARYLLTTLVAALSPVLALAQPPVALDPLQTLQRINRNYNNVTDGCREPDTQAPRGHYYCSGVTLRMVDDGPFNPWDYSPYAIKTGATSFSWIRKDLSTNRMIRPAGFILRTPMDSRALDLPVMETGFTCIFSFDGLTGPERKWYGCGPFGRPLKADFMKNSKTSPPNRNEKFAYGTCDSSNIETADDWRKNYRYARTDMNRIQVTQCSWNAEQPSDWNAMIDVHENPRTVGKDGFARKERINEFLLSNVDASQQKSPDDGSARLPYIDAVVWDVNSTYVTSTRGDTKKARPTKGLEPARSFQRKLYAQGYAVPVLRLDFTKPPAERFTYAAEDQVIALGKQPAPDLSPAPSRLIASSQWTQFTDAAAKQQRWGLKVIPTAAGRSASNDALYQEVVRLNGQDPQWQEGGVGTMRVQLACLHDNYRNKAEWNLEPHRPAVSEAKAKIQGCNPK